MGQAVLLILAFATAYLGFALLAISQPQHRQRIASGEVTGSPRETALRVLGAILLAGSLVIAIWRDGPAFGPILWTVLLTTAGTVVAFTLTLAPVRLRPLLRFATCRR